MKITTFKNIDASALNIKLTEITMERVDFDNKELLDNDPNYFSKFGENDPGVTWLLVENSNTIN